MLLIGGPGSGKTYTALRVGSALASLVGGPGVALIDTEHSSASLYAEEPNPDGGRFSFAVADLSTPDDVTGRIEYTVERYADALEACKRAGFQVVVVDSLTHAWNGPGGILELVERAGGRKGGNKWAGWSEGTPAQNRFIQALLDYPGHLICTTRSKIEWGTPDEKGKPVRVGTSAVQRDGLEYEFAVVLDLDQQHRGFVSKSRIPELQDRTLPSPGADLANLVHAWLTRRISEPLSPSEILERQGLLASNGYTVEAVDEWLVSHGKLALSARSPDNQESIARVVAKEARAAGGGPFHAWRKMGQQTAPANGSSAAPPVTPSGGSTSGESGSPSVSSSAPANGSPPAPDRRAELQSQIAQLRADHPDLVQQHAQVLGTMTAKSSIPKMEAFVAAVTRHVEELRAKALEDQAEKAWEGPTGEELVTECQALGAELGAQILAESLLATGIPQIDGAPEPALRRLLTRLLDHIPDAGGAT